MFAVDLKALKPGVHQRARRVIAADLEMDEATLTAAGFASVVALSETGADPLGPVDVDLTLTLSAGQLLVDIAVATDAWLECDRTLEPYCERIEGRHQVYCAEADPDQDDADDFIRLESGQETLDLTSAVRDTVLLALPLRRVSPRGAAQEIGTRYGEGGGTDPRWDALKALRDPDDASDSATERRTGGRSDEATPAP